MSILSKLKMRPLRIQQHKNLKESLGIPTKAMTTSEQLKPGFHADVTGYYVFDDFDWLVIENCVFQRQKKSVLSHHSQSSKQLLFLSQLFY